MNKIKLFILSLTALACFSFFSCSDEGEDADSTDPQYLFFKPYVEWGSPKLQISSKMAGCDVLLDEDNTLCYQSEGETIAYGFKNNKLNTIVVIPKATLSLDEILLAFKGYTLLSQYDTLVYLDEKSNTIAEIENGDGFYIISWSQYGLDMANAVDLGLSVKWADVNLDMGYADCAALTPENIQDDVTRCFNGLIGWGDPTGIKKSENENDYPKTSSISGTIYDVAKAKWGGKWRIATQSEFQELISACIWTWEGKNGYYGYKITGPNGNSIFLPITGYRRGFSCYSIDKGYYWTGTMRTGTSPYPYVLNFDKANKGLNTTSVSGLAYPFKNFGCAIRPVQDK
ncbi:hypothetical protein AB9N12_06755 [Bacteroides sp. AN502(2024)]